MGGVLESCSEAGVTGRRSSAHHHSALWAQRGLLQSDQEIPGAALSQPQHWKQVQSDSYLYQMLNDPWCDFRIVCFIVLLDIITEYINNIVTDSSLDQRC